MIDNHDNWDKMFMKRIIKDLKMEGKVWEIRL